MSEALYAAPGCRVERVVRDGGEIVLVVRAARPGACCPGCGVVSAAPHSTYVRRPADLPSLGRSVRLELHVRRFYCRWAGCPRRTFAERLPGLLDRRARRTHRLAAAQAAAAIEAGGEGASRLLARLGMPASADTLLRLTRRVPLPKRATPRALGVDDWAIRKGQTYGTILVDLDARCVVDLLPDRTAPTLAAWLRRRPGVAVVARDRSTEYARAVSAAAPQAVQVADRWHLLLNARQAAERWLVGIHGRLRALPTIATALPAARAGPWERSDADAAVSAANRARWHTVYVEVRRRYAAGEPLMRIARAMGLARGTVRRFAYAACFPERARHPLRTSILDPFIPYLAARQADGCENARQLWREIVARGYPGGTSRVHRWLRERRRVPAPTQSPARRAAAATRLAERRGTPAPLPSPKQLAWLVGQPPDALGRADAAHVARIAQDPDVARGVVLVRRFVALVRDRSAAARGDALAAWLAEARASGIRPLATFAAGLAHDGAAVHAALTTPWSNAQSEGHVTKLKLLKRQMYGRANFDLLRRRVLLAA